MTIGPRSGAAGAQAAAAQAPAAPDSGLLRPSRPLPAPGPSPVPGPLPAPGPSPAPGPLQVKVQRLHPDAPLPSYAVEGDAGADLCTMVDVRLQPGERALLPTGLAIALPAGYAGFVQPRSGLAWRTGLGMVNAPGTIDSGYRGEIKVIVVNHDRDHAVELRRGDRIAQLVIQRVEQARFEAVERLPDSARGAAGHGSTGGAGALAGGAPAPDNRGDDQ
ncbi:MAG TPA: dUTP diphosphatase [Jatrophihabitans sp.]|nr:dUTP diphosphatase [Jatrophihabitans sp.]